jgi:hypothetical protein
VGDGKKVIRKRATGTRERVVAFLTEAGELYDKDGLASTRLAAAVGYPGSSVAFAQLLSGMERSGLIVREVHGKRTYRIALGDVEGFGPVSRAPALAGLSSAGVSSAGVASAGVLPTGVLSAGVSSAGVLPDGFDYDELARRLLVQVVRRLAAGPASAPATELAEENVRLREQLRSAQRSLAMARDQFRRLPITSDLDNAEVVLLQRLLSGDPGVEASLLDQASLLYEASLLDAAGRSCWRPEHGR